MNGILEINEAYEVQKYMPSALVIGDDGGGMTLLYVGGNDGFGIYLTGFGDLDAETALKIAPSLSDFLIKNIGIDNFKW